MSETLLLLLLAVLCAVVLFESRVLWVLMTNTVWLRNIFKKPSATSLETDSDETGLSDPRAEVAMPTPATMKLPTTVFGIPKLDGEPFTQDDLQRVSAMLLLINPTDQQQVTDIADTVRGLRSKVVGTVFVVGRGSYQECQALWDQELRMLGDGVVVLVDPDGVVAQSLNVTHMPAAFELDRDGKIVKFGASLTNVVVDQSPGLEEEDNGRPLCIITRFGIKSPLGLLRMYLSYRRILRDIDGLEGLISSSFLPENLNTCFIISFWSDVHAITVFNTTVSHIMAANGSFSLVSRSVRDKAEIWSARFRLEAPSPFNIEWNPEAWSRFQQSTESK